jgi:Ca-activated chloride channel homolog
MKRGMVAALLLTAGTLAQGMGWTDLWSRPDQQSLAQRQQAYEEIQGQQYAAAAQHLQPYADPVSQYNRGNALAHAGDLQAALSAYDAVLHDAGAGAGLQRDARHNRDLVAEQLKSQQQPDKSGNGNGKDSQGGANPKDDKTQDAQDHAPDKSNAGRGDQAPRDQKPEGARPQSARASPDTKNPAPGGQGNPADVRAGDAVPPPQTEQTQSLDQWLRWIPDDPSGLLRRKFMIEHMRQQQETQQ